MSAYSAVVEATVQRARPVILTALALLFLPALYSIWLKIRPDDTVGEGAAVSTDQRDSLIESDCVQPLLVFSAAIAPISLRLSSMNLRGGGTHVRRLPLYTDSFAFK